MHISPPAPGVSSKHSAYVALLTGARVRSFVGAADTATPSMEPARNRLLGPSKVFCLKISVNNARVQFAATGSDSIFQDESGVTDNAMISLRYNVVVQRHVAKHALSMASLVGSDALRPGNPALRLQRTGG